MERRLFLKSTLAGSAVAVAAGAGLLTPNAVLAAWPEAAFGSKAVDDALKALYGSSSTSAGDITITAPDIAENGAVVPVTVETNISNVEGIALLVREANSPLVADYVMGGTAGGMVATRIKMGGTSDVVAVVKAGGSLYSASQQIQVTVGGCGG